MGHVKSKARSLGQTALKLCLPSKSHGFASIFIKLSQNIHFDDIMVKFEYGPCRIKN